MEKGRLLFLLTIMVAMLAACADSDSPTGKDPDAAPLFDANEVRSVDFQGEG